MLKKVALAVAAALAAQAASAAGIDYHGYVRSGVTQNADGGPGVCLGNGGVNFHRVGRLGDECDTYAEMNFGTTVAKENDRVWKVVSTIAYGTAEAAVDAGSGYVQLDTQGNSWQQTTNDVNRPWDNNRISMREMYGQVTGLMGTSTIWVGKRFGNRKDIHILDLFYLSTAGSGVGFDNLSMGPLKLSMGWVKSAFNGGSAAFPGYAWPPEAGEQPGDGNGNQPAGDAVGQTWQRVNKLDTRLAFNITKNNALDLVWVYGKPTVTDMQRDAGQSTRAGNLFTAELTTSALLGGFNKFVAQYGTNGFAALADNFAGQEYPTWFGESKGWRLIDHGVISLGSRVDVSYAAIIGKQNTDSDWADTKFKTLVVRPVIKETEFMSTAIELGYDDTDHYNSVRHNNQWGGTSMTKVTLAQQLSPGASFWARPVFRAYVTAYGGDRAVENAKVTYGAQVEAWW